MATAEWQLVRTLGVGATQYIEMHDLVTTAESDFRTTIWYTRRAGIVVPGSVYRYKNNASLTQSITCRTRGVHSFIGHGIAQCIRFSNSAQSLLKQMCTEVRTGMPTVCGWVTERTLYPERKSSVSLHANIRGASESLKTVERS